MGKNKWSGNYNNWARHVGSKNRSNLTCAWCIIYYWIYCEKSWRGAVSFLAPLPPARKYWVGNLVLSQKFGNFSRANATISRLLFVAFQYHQTRSLCPCTHETVWFTFALKNNCAQTWPPWPKFATPFHANGFTFSTENLSDISQHHMLFKTHFWWFLKKRIHELWAHV